MGSDLKGLNRSDFCPKEHMKRLDQQMYLSQQKIGNTGNVKITLIFFTAAPRFIK